MKGKLLLLIQTHDQAAALMGCVPHLRANYDWLWVVYSPAILADPKVVEQEMDRNIRDLEQAMDAAFARRDGAGGDALKLQYDAAVLEKTKRVKEAWRTLSPEQQKEAVQRIFGPFWEAKPCPNMAIHQAQDHFETAAHVEFQNSLKAAMPKQFVPGTYGMHWPTSLPAEGVVVAPVVTPPLTAATPTTPAPTKDPKAKTAIDPRLRDLLSMNAQDLGLIAFELGVKPNDPILTAHRLKLAHHVHKLEKAAKA